MSQSGQIPIRYPISITTRIGSKRQLQRNTRVTAGIRNREPTFRKNLGAIGPDSSAKALKRAVTLSPIAANLAGYIGPVRVRVDHFHRKRGTCKRSNLANIINRSDFNDVHADQVDATKTADDLNCLVRC